MRVIKPFRPQELDPRIRADERGREIRDHDKDVDETRAADLHAAQQIRHRHADERRYERGHDRDLKAVDERAPVILLREELHKVAQIDLPAGKKALDEQHTDGIDDEQQKEREQNERQRCPAVEALFSGVSHKSSSRMTRERFPSAVKTLMRRGFTRKRTSAPSGMTAHSSSLSRTASISCPVGSVRK